MYITLSVREVRRGRGHIAFSEKGGLSTAISSSRETIPEHLVGKRHRIGLFAKLARRMVR